MRNETTYVNCRKKVSKQSLSTINGQSVVNVKVTEVTMPLWEKVFLTIEEASEYTGIGINKLRELSNKNNCEFVLFNGNKRLFHREKLVKFLSEQFSI